MFSKLDSDCVYGEEVTATELQAENTDTVSRLTCNTDGPDCEGDDKIAAVKKATLQAKKTDAVPHFPHSTDSPDKESEGKSGNIRDPKITFSRDNLQLWDNSVQIAEFCKGAAKRLSNVISWVKENGHTELFLRDFAHSASCKNINCNPFCKMFKRLRKHVISAKHNCSLLRLYSLVLRLHVNTCTNNNCGLNACPILRTRKQLKYNGLNATEYVIKKTVPDYKIKKRPFLISRIIASETENKLVIFLAKPVKTMNIPVPSPQFSK